MSLLKLIGKRSCLLFFFICLWILFFQTLTGCSSDRVFDPDFPGPHECLLEIEVFKDGSAKCSLNLMKWPGSPYQEGERLDEILIFVEEGDAHNSTLNNALNYGEHLYLTLGLQDYLEETTMTLATRTVKRKIMYGTSEADCWECDFIFTGKTDHVETIFKFLYGKYADNSVSHDSNLLTIKIPPIPRNLESPLTVQDTIVIKYHGDLKETNAPYHDPDKKVLRWDIDERLKKGLYVQLGFPP